MKDLGRVLQNKLAFFNSHVSTYGEALNFNSGNGPWFIGHTPVSPFLSLIYCLSVRIYVSVCVRERENLHCVTWSRDSPFSKKKQDKIQSTCFFKQWTSRIGKAPCSPPLPPWPPSVSVLPCISLQVSAFCVCYHPSGVIPGSGAFILPHSVRTGSGWSGWWETEACWAILIKRRSDQIDSWAILW